MKTTQLTPKHNVSVLASCYKVMRKQHAEKFITQNHPDVPQSKRKSFIKVLCEYEQFLNTE